jgi:hypothetical protein
MLLLLLQCEQCKLQLTYSATTNVALSYPTPCSFCCGCCYA